MSADGEFFYAVSDGHIHTYDGVAFTLHTEDILRVSSDANIYDLVLFNGEIVICGDFTSVDGVAIERRPSPKLSL